MSRRILAILTLMLLTSGLAYAAGPPQGTSGMVYAMTNAEAGNQVLAFDRFPDGTLGTAQAYDTGGFGLVGGVTIDPLGSQGSLTLSRDHRWLLAVNAGSNEISVFRVKPRGLALTDVVVSGGVFPVSVTSYHDLVYVLNAGGSCDDCDAVDNITGFRLSPKGTLTLIAGSTRALSQDVTGPAQVGFTPDGSMLVVTEKATNLIDVFTVGQDGLPSPSPVSTPSEGPTPFGLVFNRRGRLLVSEVGMMTGSVSSYVVLADGNLDPVSPAVPNMGQIATCWIAIGGRFAFTANTGSDTLSAYRVRSDGSLTLLEPEAADLMGAKPIDMAIPRSGRFLYTLNAKTGTIGMFAVGPDGTLTDLGDAPGLPVDNGAQGIAAR
jgi:6-phosphogluconolactonase